VLAELQQKFHTFLIYPQKSMSERRRDIDAEIKQRVEAAGGRYEGVDIRASTHSEPRASATGAPAPTNGISPMW